MVGLLKEKKKVYTFLDQLIVNPVNIKTNNEEPYKVYGPFYRKWIDNINRTNLIENSLIQVPSTPAKIRDLGEREISSIKNSDINYCLTRKSQVVYNLISSNRFNNSNLCPCKPGESNSIKQLNFPLNNLQNQVV